MTDSSARLLSVRRFAEEAIDPYAASWEMGTRFPRELVRAAADVGLNGMFVPQSLGGWDLSQRDACDVIEILSEYDLGATFSLIVHLNLTSALMRADSRHLREFFGARLLSGSAVGAFCLTEPQSGSDAASIQTSIIDDGDEVVVSGRKAWVTNGDGADVFHVYGRDPKLGESWKAIRSVMVEKETVGVVIEKPPGTSGANVMRTTTVSFDSCRVSNKNLFLPPGKAFPHALAAIDAARILVGAMGTGAGFKALKLAIDYATEREQFGTRLSNFQGLRWKLAEVATGLVAGRSLTHEAAHCLDRGSEATTLAAMAKLFVGENSVDAIGRCAQVMGAFGYSSGTSVERLWRQARMLSIIDGTSEIQREVVGRALFEGAALSALRTV